jgi:hypothetical protein
MGQSLCPAARLPGCSTTSSVKSDTLQEKIKKNLFIIIALVVIAAVVAAIAFFIYDSTPEKIISASARLGGGDGSLVVVEFQTDKAMKTDYNADQAYMIVEASNRTLPIKWIPKIGLLISKSTGKELGWFIVDNLDNEVKNGTMVSIVIGDYKKEHYQVFG